MACEIGVGNGRVWRNHIHTLGPRPSEVSPVHGSGTLLIHTREPRTTSVQCTVRLCTSKCGDVLQTDDTELHLQVPFRDSVHCFLSPFCRRLSPLLRRGAEAVARPSLLPTHCACARPQNSIRSSLHFPLRNKA